MWKSIGAPTGGVTSAPEATNYSESGYASGGFFVAVRGGDGGCWHKYSLDGGANWSSWFSHGGQILAGTGPTAVSPTTTSVRFAVTGTNHAVYFWTGSAWKSLGGYLTSSPDAGSALNGDIVLVARGGNGLPYSIESTNSGSTWSSWYQV